MHSPLISGTFGLSIGGNEVIYSSSANLPFDIGSFNLQQAINNLRI
jgi:hypothetical protein